MAVSFLTTMMLASILFSFLAPVADLLTWHFLPFYFTMFPELRGTVRYALAHIVTKYLKNAFWRWYARRRPAVILPRRSLAVRRKVTPPTLPSLASFDFPVPHAEMRQESAGVRFDSLQQYRESGGADPARRPMARPKGRFARRPQ